VDAAAGVLSLLTFGAAARLGASAPKVVEAASALGKVSRAAALVDLLAHGVALGYEAYLDVASGRVPWEEVAGAAVLAAGPVAERVRAVAALLAGGGAVALFLGEPLPEARSSPRRSTPRPLPMGTTPSASWMVLSRPFPPTPRRPPRRVTSAWLAPLSTWAGSLGARRGAAISNWPRWPPLAPRLLGPCLRWGTSMWPLGRGSLA